MKARKCTKCNRTKKAHLYPRTKIPSKVCKSCKRKESAKVKALKQVEDWHLWKARGMRSQWLARASKVGAVKSTVPGIAPIKKWLIKQEPYTCYFTGRSLNRDSMQLDHLTPVSRGGGFNLTNVATTSKDMNLLKADILAEDFIQLLDLVSDWEDKGNALFKMMRGSRSMWRK